MCRTQGCFENPRLCGVFPALPSRLSPLQSPRLQDVRLFWPIVWAILPASQARRSCAATQARSSVSVATRGAILPRAARPRSDGSLTHANRAGAPKQSCFPKPTGQNPRGGETIFALRGALAGRSWRWRGRAWRRGLSERLGVCACDQTAAIARANRSAFVTIRRSTRNCGRVDRAFATERPDHTVRGRSTDKMGDALASAFDLDMRR
jgi:hypothetical protein